MRAWPILIALTVSACWQVEVPTVPAADWMRPEGVRDGLYRRSDGSELAVRWNPAERVFEVGGAVVGKARVAPAGPALYRVELAGNLRLSLLARVDGQDVVVMAPSPAVEKRLAAASGAVLKPGPITFLSGPPEAVEKVLAEAAKLPAGELVEAGRLKYQGALK